MIIVMEQCKKTLSKEGEGLPCNMQEYINHNGRHFNGKLLAFAVGNMRTKDGAITPIGEGELSQMLSQYGIAIGSTTATIHDKLFAANMCQADYYGSSIPDKEHLCRYVRDVIDDADGYEGLVFSRWCADMEAKDIHVEWEKYL